MTLEDLKNKLIEHEDCLKIWREEEKSDKTDWNIGYNDGFEDAYKSLKKELER